MFLTYSDILSNNAPKRRIVSVVPSQTEFLYDLGLDEEVVGITKFCIHPEKWFRNKQRIGGTKDLKLDLIRDLKPDLIIANKEENTQSQIEELAAEFPLYMSDIFDLEDSFRMMKDVGALTGKQQRTNELITIIQDRFKSFTAQPSGKKVLYLIWRGPFMAAGHNTFIHSMIERCGWKNVLTTDQHKDLSRYPELSAEEIIGLDPEVILLSSEPYPFKDKHIRELQEICSKAAIMLVDGELFSWYGSRLKFSPAHFNAVLERLRYFHGV